jgi:hypothetical protein
MKIVQATLRRLHSPDVDNLETYVPLVPECFGILVQAMFGPEGAEGEESFDILVCTPAWLAERVQSVGFLSGRNQLVVSSFNFSQLRDFIVEYGKSATGETWRDVAKKLARLGKWEFEDYVP